MTLQTISVDVSPRRIATVLLNRPDRGNSFNQVMLDELGAQFKALAADDNVRIVVLRGAGKHFCTGADLQSRGPELSIATATGHDHCATCWSRSTACQSRRSRSCRAARIGGGAGLVTCCDVASPLTTRSSRFRKCGSGWRRWAIMPFMIRAMGHRNFRRYGLSGERIRGGDALRIGLVHEVCDAACLDDVLARITDDLLLGAPHAASAQRPPRRAYASPNLDEILRACATAARSALRGGTGRHRGVSRKA